MTACLQSHDTERVFKSFAEWISGQSRSNMDRQRPAFDTSWLRSDEDDSSRAVGSVGNRKAAHKQLKLA